MLTKLIKRKNQVVKKVESDHNVLITKFKLVWSHTNKKERIQTFNFKNEACQQKFKEVTSEPSILSSFFDSKEDLNLATKHFLKRLDGCIYESFRKIRILERSNDEISKLFERRKHLRSKDDKESKDELNKVEEALADKRAKENYEQILEDINPIQPGL